MYIISPRFIGTSKSLLKRSKRINKKEYGLILKSKMGPSARLDV